MIKRLSELLSLVLFSMLSNLHFEINLHKLVAVEVQCR